MAKATKPMKQALSYRSGHAVWFAATQTLFNQVAAFYFQAHPDVLHLSNKDALSALEHLTHVTKEHPHPLHQVFLIHYGSSMSSGHAAHTRSADYVGVPEAAPLERLRSVTARGTPRQLQMSRYRVSIEGASSVPPGRGQAP